MTNNDVNSAQLEADEDGGRSKTFMAAVGIVGAIVALGVALSIANLVDDDPVAPQASSSPSSSTPPETASTESASMCGLTDVQETGTVNLAPAAEWALVGTTAAPAIKGQGPGKVETDGFRSCYARTPTGALLAASNLTAMGSTPDLGKRATKDLTVPGPGRDVALAAPSGSSSSSVRIQIAAFRLLRYDGKTADVDMALRTSTGAIGAQVFNLRWHDGDWKVVLADSGDLKTPLAQIPSLSGYVLWSGV